MSFCLNNRNELQKAVNRGSPICLIDIWIVNTCKVVDQCGFQGYFS